VSPVLGVLAAGASTNVTARTTSIIANLANGLYSGDISFRNNTTHSEKLSSFALQVGLFATTFDDLIAESGRPLPAGYDGFEWKNFFVLNSVATTKSPSGYKNGMISPPNVIYNAFGNPATIIGINTFDLISAYVTAAWRDNLSLSVTGSLNGNILFTLVTNLSTTEPIFVNFDFFGVDKVDFMTSGGTTNSAYADAQYQFVADNVLLVSHSTRPLPPLIETPILSEKVVGIGWPTQLGRTYQIQYTPTLSPPNWMSLGPPIIATTSVIRTSDWLVDHARFYRLLALP
jgi:hypothetical protein